ncbi:hypothetical protein AZ026_000235, partial [Klebsiella pneumoniae]
MCIRDSRHVEWEIQYRVYGSGSGWVSHQGEYALKNVNGLGFTERITLSSPGLVEVRCRRRNEQGSNNARDSMYWQALRGRLLTRPSSYPGVSLMAVTVETGGKLAAQSDRRVNVVATRAYDSGTARTISGALLHVGNSLGLEMDVDTINALESAYWTPRGENFDFATGDSISALEMLQKIANAGKSRFLLSDGLATVNREGIKPWTGVITPHEMVEELQSGFTVPSDDDFDGVDVTYINGTTWAEETVKCRTPDNPCLLYTSRCGTSSGTGLDMAQTSPDADDIIADSMTVSGSSVTFTGLDTDDDDDNDENDNALPPSWVAGAVVELKAPANYQITSAAGYSVIASPLLTEIAPVVGMPVTLGFNSVDYDLFIASYTPGQAAVPGAGGSAAKLQASAAPTTYDFSTSSSTFTITWQGITYPVSLVANYVSMSGLLAAITEGLTGSGLVAQDNGGTVLITEAASPFAGGAITSSSLPAAVFGDAPVYTSGTASTGGSPAVTANVTLAYNSATGTSFSGMPEGVQRLSLAHRGNEYRIVSTDGTTATVARLVNGAVDESWPGFTARTMIDYEATGLNDTLSWLGPFLVCPENETVDMFEVNFSFPNGICGFDSKGKKRLRHVEWEIQYRVYGSGSGWVSHQGEYALKNVNGLGFTERIT